MGNLNLRLGKLESMKGKGLQILLLDQQEGETEDEARARLGVGLPKDANVLWITRIDAQL